MKLIVTILAAIGLCALLGGGYMYYRGLSEFDSGWDPKAPQVIGDFTRRSLVQGVASANIVKLALAKGVSRDDAIESMKLRANQRNIALVQRLALHKEVKNKTGKDYPYTEIFLFCDPLTASALLDYNRDYAAYMPCSITLFADAEGKYWLVTMNLDMLIYGGHELEPELKQRVLAVKEGLLDIMAAGATGSL